MFCMQELFFASFMETLSYVVQSTHEDVVN